MNRNGTRWRGKLPIPAHAHPLVRKLIEEANRQQTTLGEIAERANLRRETISEWRYRKEPRVSNLVAAFNVLGLDLIVAARREP